VLSRCQRFDLRRIPTPMLTEHFGGICEKEAVAAEPEALAMIAAAAEGSVRDGLSILDQAIAHADLDAEGKVTAAQVRDMLGLADKSVQRKLFTSLLAGDGPALLDLVAEQFALGVEPVGMMRGVMNLAHHITVAQISPGVAEAASVEEQEAIEGWAGSLSAGQLHRLWQLLLKGHEEVRTAPDPLVAVQMALLRVMHAADLPDPGKLAKQIEELASRPAAAPVTAGSEAGSPPRAQAAPHWEALVEQVENAGQMAVASKMRMQIRVTELASGRLRYAQAPGFNEDLAPELRAVLFEVTGQRWQVERCEGEGAPSLVERDAAAKADAEEQVRRAPLVAAALAAFPDAEIVNEEQAAGQSRGGRNWSQNR
jgi:DNA polymerase-3 subunit gamma/tau